MQKIMIIWILLVCFWAYEALAKNIDLNGEWWWINPNFQIINDKFNLQQNNYNITGSYNSHDCGIVNINGSIQDNNVGINLNFSPEVDDCPNWIQIVASCSNEDCSILNGKWRDSNHLIGSLTWIKENKDFYISSPEQNTKFYIDVNPKMPTLEFITTSTYPFVPLHWSLNMNFHWRRGNTNVNFPIVITDTNRYSPDMTFTGIVGGDVTTTVIYDSKKIRKIAIGKYQITGKNPGIALIQESIVDPFQLKIACVESNFRQFEASREGGEGLPLIGKNDHNERIGGVGIMQVKHKPIIPKTVWNWRENMSNGLCMLNKKRYYSKRFHINERIRLNTDRRKLGLPSCPKNMPPPLTEAQLIRDSIRRYNYGVEYRWEPRDGKNCAGNWVVSPSCLRNPRDGCDKNYVDKVLSCEIQ